MPGQLPISLKLEGKPVLLVGGGKIAEEKLKKLLEAGARVRVVAKTGSCAIQTAAAQNPDAVIFEEREFEPGDVEGNAIVVTATGDPEVNRTVAQTAQSRGIWVNSVDRPEDCTFYFTATLSRGPVKLSISSEGSHPGLVRALREILEEILPPGHDFQHEQLAQRRAEVLARFPDPGRRLEILRRISEMVRNEYLLLGEAR